MLIKDNTNRSTDEKTLRSLTKQSRQVEGWHSGHCGGGESYTLKLTDGWKEQKCYHATVKQTMPKPKQFKCQEYNMKQPMCQKERMKKSHQAKGSLEKEQSIQSVIQRHAESKGRYQIQLLYVRERTVLHLLMFVLVRVATRAY